eukprot:scaffold193485_cov32-Tisochrysis_lutea.AAC.5
MSKKGVVISEDVLLASNMERLEVAPDTAELWLGDDWTPNSASKLSLTPKAVPAATLLPLAFNCTGAEIATAKVVRVEVATVKVTRAEVSERAKASLETDGTRGSGRWRGIEVDPECLRVSIAAEDIGRRCLSNRPIA